MFNTTPADAVLPYFHVFSYNRPIITGVSGVPVSPDGGIITVNGSNFGDDPAIISATVGDAPCIIQELLSHNAFTCQVTTTGTGLDVVVQVGWELSDPFVGAVDVADSGIWGEIVSVDVIPLNGGEVRIVLGRDVAEEDAATLEVYVHGLDLECEQPRLYPDAATIVCALPAMWHNPDSDRTANVWVEVTLAGDIIGETDPLATEIVIPSSSNVLRYVPILELITWEEAHERASSALHEVHGAGYLASLDSAEEHNYLQSVFPKRDGWIGRVWNDHEFRFEWTAGPLSGRPPSYSAEEQPELARPLPAYVTSEGTWLTATSPDMLLTGFFIQFGQCGDLRCGAPLEDCVTCSIDCSDCNINGVEVSTWVGNDFQGFEWHRAVHPHPTLSGKQFHHDELPHPAVSVEWRGHIQVPEDGVYAFEVALPEVHGGLKLMLNNEPLLLGLVSPASRVLRSVTMKMERIHLQEFILQFWSPELTSTNEEFELRWVAESGDVERIPSSNLFVRRESSLRPVEYTSPWGGEYHLNPVHFGALQDRDLRRSVLAYDPTRWYDRTFLCEWDHFEDRQDQPSIATPHLMVTCEAARASIPIVPQEIPVSVLWTTHDPDASVPTPFDNNVGVLAATVDGNPVSQVCVLQDYENGPGSMWTYHLDERIPLTRVIITAFNLYTPVQDRNGTFLPRSAPNLELQYYDSSIWTQDFVTVASRAWGDDDFIVWDVELGITSSILRLVVDDRNSTYSVCISEFTIYEQLEDPYPLCDCLADGSWGSVCGKHTNGLQPWCYISPECGQFREDDITLREEWVGTRTRRPWKPCVEEVNFDTCSGALIITHGSGSTYHANTAVTSDDAYSHLSCFEAPYGLPGVWFKFVGKGEEITLDTCSPETTFSSHISVMHPKYENHCEFLECTDVELSRRSCDAVPYTSAVVTFTAQRGEWYYVFVSGGVTPLLRFAFPFGRGLVGLNVHGNVQEWNDGVQFPEEPGAFADVLPFTSDVTGEKICLGGFETVLVDEDGIDCEIRADGSDSCDGFGVLVCRDIDECASGAHSCPEDNQCVNEEGSYHCDCTGAYHPHPNTTHDCLDTVESFTAWELLERYRRHQLSNQIQKEQQITADAKAALEGKLEYERLVSEYTRIRQTRANDVPRLQAWTAAAELYARYADAAVPPLPGRRNIGYLGLGYDMFGGYPASFSGRDPGWRSPPIDMQYGIVRTSSDARFTLPDNVHAFSSPSSQFESQSSIVSNEDELRSEAMGSTEFSAGVKVGYENGGFAAGAGVEFSSNSEFQESSERLSTQETQFVQVRGSVTSYVAHLVDGAPALISPSFRAAVENLDPQCNYPPSARRPNCPADSLEDYYQLLDIFGTHYTDRIVMGGKAYERYEVSIEELQRIIDSSSSNSFSAEASVTWSGYGVTGNIFGGGKTTSTLASHARSLRTSKNTARKEWFIGGVPSAGSSENGELDSLKRWAATVEDNPAPVDFRAAPLPALLTSKQFPDDEFIVAKRTFLQSLLYDYCVRSGSLRCGEFLPVLETPPDGVSFTDLVYVEQLIPGNVSHAAAGESPQDRLYRMFTRLREGESEYRTEIGYIEPDGTLKDAEDNTVSTTRYVASLTDVPQDTICYCDPGAGKPDIELKFQISGVVVTTLLKVFYNGALFADLTVHENGIYTLRIGNPFSWNGGDLEISMLPTEDMTVKGFSLKSLAVYDQTLSNVQILVNKATCDVPEWNRVWKTNEIVEMEKASCVKGSNFNDPCTPLYRLNTAFSTEDCFNDYCRDESSVSAEPGCVGYAQFGPNEDVGAGPMCVAFSTTMSGTSTMVCTKRGNPLPPYMIFPTPIVESSGVITETLDGDPNTYYKLISPIKLRNDIGAGVRYGSPFFFMSVHGGLTKLPNAAFGGDIMTATSSLKVNAATGRLEYDDDIPEYIGFRLLPRNGKRMGEPVRTGDEVYIQIVAGIYSISYDALDAVVLTPEGSDLMAVAARTPAFPTARIVPTEPEVNTIENVWRITKIPVIRPDAVTVGAAGARPAFSVKKVVPVDGVTTNDYTILLLVDPNTAVNYPGGDPVSAYSFSNFGAENGECGGPANPLLDQGGLLVLADPSFDPIQLLEDNSTIALSVRYTSPLEKGDCLLGQPNNVILEEQLGASGALRFAEPFTYTVPYLGEHIVTRNLNATATNFTSVVEFPAPVRNVNRYGLALNRDFVVVPEPATPCTIERFSTSSRVDAALAAYLASLETAMPGTPPPGSLISDPVTATGTIVFTCDLAAADVVFMGGTMYTYDPLSGFGDENEALQAALQKKNQYPLYA
eukprot:TRINITY_DN720_c0_g1_i2.p1 TRINITY_DN720_c0_g1~~TRINITY_DN720_c0_g1_i2.p1  ORF type:complete len:2293 (-),score=285.69 TRINITY_DN720_c0_g1_i2:137-7015(-)